MPLPNLLEYHIFGYKFSFSVYIDYFQLLAFPTFFPFDSNKHRNRFIQKFFKNLRWKASQTCQLSQSLREVSQFGYILLFLFMLHKAFSRYCQSPSSKESLDYKLFHPFFKIAESKKIELCISVSRTFLLPLKLIRQA